MRQFILDVTMTSLYCLRQNTLQLLLLWICKTSEDTNESANVLPLIVLLLFEFKYVKTGH
jgi:hypothetical protein